MSKPITTHTAFTQDTFNGRAIAVIQENGKVVATTEHDYRSQADCYLMDQGYQYESGGFDSPATYYTKKSN